LATKGAFLIVGLGNPGSKYANTRHNVGFTVVDEVARRLGISFQEKFQAQFGQGDRDGERIYLLKPMTFMNLSGESVGEAARFFKIEVGEKLLVVSDDLDLPLANLRLRLFGGPGGHNGLKSIIEHLGTENFPRLRIGIGRSEEGETTSHVLGKLSKQEEPLMKDAVQLAADGIEHILKNGVALAMNKVNQKKETK
jgi:peptidyl-tRNA hydrolase, PTH1 family